MATLTLNLIPKVAEIVRPPRSAVLRFPFGSPVGNPTDEQKQLHVLKSALGLLETMDEPGQIVELPFKWK